MMNRKKITPILVFITIMAVASFFRLYKLESSPPGLYPDEAINGNDAREALETGNFKIFYPENNGREGLFINIEALSIKAFGPSAWSLRFVSAIFGILTIAGLYLLAKEIYGWQVASLAAFLMSIGSWHVTFSRIGFRGILVPFVLVYAFYFLWRAIKHNNLLDFTLAGIFGGLGFYTYTSYRVAPLIVIIMFAVYWWNIRKDATFSKYKETKTDLLKGFAIMTLVTFLVALPIGLYFLSHAGSFNSRAGQELFVFSQPNPMTVFATSVVKTLGMFNFTGDYNWRHNISGWPELSIPIGALFVLGFLHELIHLFRRKHGHFSTTHIFLFSWFFVMLLPGFLSTEAAHALRTIGVIPVVMIFAAIGLYWLFEKLYKWYLLVDPHRDTKDKDSQLLVVVALIIFLASVGFLEYQRYFETWSNAPQTSEAFTQNYVNIATEVNSLSSSDKIKYILVNTRGTLVNSIPMPAQTVMFLTDTYTPDKQVEKNIYYLMPTAYYSGNYNQNSIVFPLQ